VAFGDHDCGSFLGKKRCGGAADPCAGTGDDGDFRLQSFHGCYLTRGVRRHWYPWKRAIITQDQRSRTMVAGKVAPVDREDTQADSTRTWWRDANSLYLVAIVLIAAALRLWEIDQTSLWYDEVITMRVARSASVPELLARLNRIDGTRAPLYPLVLQNWLRV